MPLIPRLSEALDAELLRQRKAWDQRHGSTRMAIMDLDAEQLATVALTFAADTLEQAGWKHPANHLRGEARK